MLANGDVIYPPKYVNAYVLAAGVAQAVTIPAGARVAIFNSTSQFLCQLACHGGGPCDQHYRRLRSGVESGGPGFVRIYKFFNDFSR